MPTDRGRILEALSRDGRVTSAAVGARLGISRQAAHRKLQALAKAGELVQVGAGRTAAWASSATAARRFTFDPKTLAEDRALRRVEAEVPLLRTLDPDTSSAFGYAFTGMVNNAIDHAAASSLEVGIEPRAGGLALEVQDDGIGAFARLRAGLDLASDLEAVQELSKGKVTTDPARHSGEGVFFVSKVADHFELEANGLRWIVDSLRGDSTVVASRRVIGTRVHLVLGNPIRRRLVDVFSDYSIDDAFARTRTVVNLFAIAVEFVSRSEARRLLHGLERFREVVLDFQGVAGVGQGFVDEVFRVFARAHPETVLRPEHMNDEVAFMVRRVGG